MTPSCPQDRSRLSGIRVSSVWPHSDAPLGASARLPSWAQPDVVARQPWVHFPCGQEQLDAQVFRSALPLRVWLQDALLPVWRLAAPGALRCVRLASPEHARCLLPVLQPAFSQPPYSPTRDSQFPCLLQPCSQLPSSQPPGFPQPCFPSSWFQQL